MRKIVMFLFVIVFCWGEDSLYPPTLPSASLPYAGKRFGILGGESLWYIKDYANGNIIKADDCSFFIKDGKNNFSDNMLAGYRITRARECEYKIERANELASEGKKVVLNESDLMHRWKYNFNLLRKIEKIKDKKWHLLAIPFIFDKNKYKVKNLLDTVTMWQFEDGEWIYITKDLNLSICEEENIRCSQDLKVGGLWLKKK